MGFTPPLIVDRSQQASPWGEAFADERALLGAVLTDPAIYAGLRDLIAPEDFSVALHERMFEAIPSLIEPDGSIDRTAVPPALGIYAWDADGGVDAWLDGLLSEHPVATNAVDCARAIHASAELRRRTPAAIDVDTASWCHDQAALLARLAERPDPLSRQVDWQNIIEEILFVGRSQTGGVVRKMELVFEHLVKILADPNAPSRNRWRVEINAFQARIVREAKPGMRRLIDLDAAWRQGVSDAAADLTEYAVRVPRDLPTSCPFTFEEMTAATTTVTALLEKLAATGDITPSQQP